THTSTYGTATLTTATDQVSFALDNSAANPLNVGDHPTAIFTIPVIDNSGVAASTTVSFTIDGTNDAPTVSVGTPIHLVEAGFNVAGTAAASTSVTKADVDGTVTYDATALTTAGWSETSPGSGVWTHTSTYGTATLTTATDQVSFALDNSA